MSDQIVKTSEINIQVGLNANQLPLRMLWSASDGQIDNAEAAAFLLSIWDPKSKNTMKIDLWTKDMPVDQMKMFLHQILVSLANTYQRATGEEDVAQWMEQMAEEFAAKSAIRM